MVVLARALVSSTALVLALAGGAAANARPAPARQPAQLEGLWCGIGLLHEFRLQVNQQDELFEARLMRKHRVREITGRIEGSTMRTDPQRDVTLVLQKTGDELRITEGTGQFALARGQGFARANGGNCST